MPSIQQYMVKRQIYRGEVSPYYLVDNNCVMYHAFWDGTLVDHSPNGTHAATVLCGAPAFTALGLHFDGTNDALAVANASTLANSGGDYSMCAWVNIDADSTGWDFIFGTDTGSNIFNFIVGGADPLSSYCYQIWGEGSSLNDVVNVGLPVAKGEWAFIVYMVDRNVGGYVMVNGEVVAGPLGTTNEMFPGDQVFQVAYIGLRASDNAHGLKGTIGETYYFKELVTDKCDAIYQATKARYQ